MNNTNKTSDYTTKDTALAAYLFSEGFELLDVDGSSFPTIFHFRDDNPKIHTFVHSYQTGKAVGNIATFFRAYKKMLTEIKDSKYSRRETQ